MDLFDKVIDLPKIGEKKQKLLNNLGIYNIYDLLNYFPRKYEDRRIFKKISEIKVREKVCVHAKIIRYEKVTYKFKKSIINIYVQDDTGTACIKLFNNNFILADLEKGREIFFYGLSEENIDILQFNSPEIDFDSKGKKTGLIYPLYPLTKGLRNTEIINIVKYAIENADLNDFEMLDEDIRKKYRLLSSEEAIKNIHFPKDIEILKQSRYRCIFNEFFDLNIFLGNYKKNVIEKKGIAFKRVDLSSIIKKLPFSLTASQNKVLNDIMTDMSSQSPMRRLIQGDVGSGKTVLAFLSMYNCAKNGYQSALMVPTEVLAIQHYESALKFFDSENIKVELLTKSVKSKEKIYQKIVDREVDVIIGTQALIQEKVQFSKLGLIVTDEQHRFGVNQRRELEQKSEEPADVIVMSATPIPRTLSLVIHKDLDISVIDELPKNRIRIKTIAENKKNEVKVFDFIQKQIKLGRQAYIVCPLVEENEDMDLISVDELHKKIQTVFGNDIKIAKLHGKMKSSEKEELLRDFMENNISLLISTTVIEVGINVPNATIMVIYDAQRFGLSQLHQLRGRVGRGDKQSYCVLLYEKANAITMERIKTIVSSNDGFEIARKDLELRGGGEIFGIKQHGLPEFNIADIIKNADILELSQKCAQEVLNTLDDDKIRTIRLRLYDKMNIS
jgi:ATP-dependent DNA helicase recG